MKKRTLVVMTAVLSLTLLAAGSAFARWGGGYGMMDARGERGYGNCYWNDEGRPSVDPESMVKFQKETLPLRDERLTKRLELSQEYDKEAPDADRIAQLRKDLIDLDTKIAKIADKYDVEGGFKGRRGERGKRGGYNCGGPGNCF